MHVLIAEFNHTFSDAEFESVAEQIAPDFANIPGCLEKTWLHDPSTRTAGGIYKFADEASLHAYLASPLWAGVESTPQFGKITTRVYGTMEHATRVTRGLPGVAVAR